METGNPCRLNSDVAIISLEGRLCFGDGTERLRDQVQDLLAAGRTSVILDLDGLTYVDSAGIGTMVTSYTSVRNAGGHLKLMRLNRRVRDTLMMLKLFSIFEVFDDEAKAVNSFTAKAGG